MNSERILRLLLVRHGQTDWNKEDKFCGSSDPPLNVLGFRQANELATRLAKEKISAVYSSPYTRALQTAQPLCVSLRLDVIVCEDLREQDFGNWEGCRFRDVLEQNPEYWTLRLTDATFTPPNGEALSTVAKRGRRWLDSVIQNHQGKTIVAIAHGSILQVILCTLLDTRLRTFWPYRVFAGEFAEVEVFTFGAVLLALNKSADTVGSLRANE